MCLNPSVLLLPKIEYFPMIEGACTDFTIVCTVLMHAQMASNVLEQHDAVVTFDVVLYFQAKQIRMKFPEKFRNTVVSLRRSHIGLNYLSLLGKNFSYLLALGNVSVYGLMMFIILSVFNDIQYFKISRYKAVGSPACPRNAVHPRSLVPKIIRHQ